MKATTNQKEPDDEGGINSNIKPLLTTQNTRRKTFTGVFNYSDEFDES